MASPLNVHYDVMIKAITDGRVVLFFGLGVNLCDRPAEMAWQRGQYLPSGGELAEYLAKEFDYPASETRDLARVSQYIALMIGTGPLYSELHSLFDADYPPTSLHRFFATLPAALREKGYPHPYQLIVTTNYDDLMERAFQDAGEPFDLVSYVSDGNQRGKFLHWPPEGEARLIEKPNEYHLSLDQRPVILKIHGTVDRITAERDSFVITEDDYIDYLTRTDFSNLLPPTLTAKLRRSHILFLGYSLRDWNLRVILHRIWGEQKLTWKSWAIQLNPDPLDRRSWAQRDVDILNMHLQDYVAALSERGQALLPVVPEPDWLSRLSPSSENAMCWAEGLRQAVGAAAVHTEYLLAGLYQKSGGPTQRLLTLFDDDATLHPRLEGLANDRTTSSVRLDDVRPAPRDALSTLPLSINAEKAMDKAAALADEKGSVSIRSRHLLAGLLAVPESAASQWIADTLQVERETLYRLIIETPDAAPPLEQIRRASARYRPPVLTYRPVLSATPSQVTVGQRVHLRVDLVSAPPEEGETLKLPAGVAELYCFVSADGLHVQGTEVAVMPLDPQTGQPLPADFDLQAHLRGARPYTVDLFVEDPISGQLRISQAEGQVTVNPPKPGEERLPILPTLDVRVAPHVVLQVETDLPEGDDGPHHLIYRLTSRLPGLRLDNEEVGQVVLSPGDLNHIQTLVHGTVQSATDIQPEDAHERMVSLGHYLFDRLFPTEGAAGFREAFERTEVLWQALDQPQQLPPTWLIVENGITWLPWELVAPYRIDDRMPSHFLGERYRMSRWIEGLGPPLYSEVPLGEVVLAHYKVLEPGCEDEELLTWHRLLNARSADGILQVAKPETPYYALHLLRHADPARDRLDVVARDGVVRAAFPEEEVPQARLDLRLKRPVVTLSILGRNGLSLDTSADGWLLPERVMPFLRAGASAVLGPWWPTSEAADQRFWTTFYDLLERRVPLGEATWRARLAVRRTLPHRPDWLAYTLFGDPRARPYWPEPSEGYTVLECLADGPLRSGETYNFQVSIRARPPVWYQDRLIQAEELPEQVQALFVAPDLVPSDPKLIPMTPVGRTMLQASRALTLPMAGEYPLLVQLLAGDRHIETLQLILKVDDNPTGEQTDE